MRKLAGVCALALGVLASSPQAQEEAGATPQPEAPVDAPFYRGSYFAPMASYIRSDAERIDDGFGGVFAAGYRFGWYAFEFSALYSSISSDGGGSATEAGGSLNGLVFPFSSLPNLFLIAEVGGLELKDYPLPKDESIALTTFGGGVGNLFKFAFGDYEFGLRAEALYRYGVREANHQPGGDLDAPREFGDILVNLGLQLPLGSKPPPPKVQPVQVVPVIAPADSDGDGVPDDLDRCPGTAAGATVDANGCVPPPPCKSPTVGERITLAGCGAGDVIVLHGVNFEFDKSRLTPNAKTILDNVADELKAHPALQIELGGHTDDRGGDNYNQQLSEARAQSVRAHLVEAGIADDRMTAAGYGEAQPVADNQTDEGRELNRRVELKVTQVDTVGEPMQAASSTREPAVDPSNDAQATAQ